MMSENEQAVHQLPSGTSTKSTGSSSTSIETVVRVTRVGRDFVLGDGQRFSALQDISLTVALGKSLALVGSSGSGKSTLLHLLAGLDRPTTGHLTVAGLDLTGQSEDDLARHRGRNIGVVFQFFQLLPTLTALENVLLPMQLVGHIPASKRQRRAEELLAQFEVADQGNKLVTTLSGGQQQRVAIARALANDPPLLVADEPTGNLDSRTAQYVLDLLLTLPSLGKTVIVATHEARFLPRFDRVVALQDGKIKEEAAKTSAERRVASGAEAC